MLVAITWLPLPVLAAFGGALVRKTDVPFLEDPAPYARFLVALPLLLLAGGIVDRVLGLVTRQLSQTGLLLDDGKAGLERAVDWLTAQRDRTWVEALLLVAVYVMTFYALQRGADARLGRDVTSWMLSGDGVTEQLTMAGWWYFLVSVPVFEFLVFRWIWRYVIWIGFLGRASRLDLQLEPTHPDLAGGLGFLPAGQMAFGIVAVAIGAFFAGILGHEILHLGGSLSVERGTIGAFCIVGLLVLLAPLVLFGPKLMQAKRKGLVEYGALGSSLSHAFGKRWTGRPVEAAEMIESPDASTVADFGACFERIQKMRTVPVSLGTVIRLAVLLLLPFVPLILTESSVKEVLRKLLGLLS